MCDWLKRYALRAVVAYEFGDVSEHAHVQVVATCKATSSTIVKSTLSAHLWGPDIPSGATICCKDLSQCEVHTFLGECHTQFMYMILLYLHNVLLCTVIGMTGYCGKTDQPGNTSFRCFLVNVTPAYYAEGKSFYVARARPRLSKLICIDMKNILLKAYTYATLMIRDRCTDLVSILLRMLQSGKYYPCATWVITYTCQGMDVARAQTIFKAMLEPETVTREDVVFLFFRTITRWEKAKYFGWATQIRQHAGSWAQDWIDGPEVSVVLC